MSTPGAIAVYGSGAGAPDHVATRRWRGVYHHWGGAPSDLGDHLIARVREARGDLGAVVRQLVDGAPWGWSSCVDEPFELAPKRGLLHGIASLLGRGPDERSTARYPEDDPGLPVSPDDTGSVAFVYVFDLEARRLDAFATHARARGERIGSVTFSPRGVADPRAFDLVAGELIAEPPLVDVDLSATALMAVLNGLPRLETDSLTLDWIRVEEQSDARCRASVRRSESSEAPLGHDESVSLRLRRRRGRLGAPATSQTVGPCAPNDPCGIGCTSVELGAGCEVDQPWRPRNGDVYALERLGQPMTRVRVSRS